MVQSLANRRTGATSANADSKLENWGCLKFSDEQYIVDCDGIFVAVIIMHHPARCVISKAPSKMCRGLTQYEFQGDM
jgi:hypothetical protein